VRGDWTGQFRVAGQGESNMRMTFSGGILSGDNQGHINALDAPGREAGTFTIDGNQIEFEMHYVPGTILFQGTIEDVNHMSGTWRLAHDPPHGTWTLERSI